MFFLDFATRILSRRFFFQVAMFLSLYIYIYMKVHAHIIKREHHINYQQPTSFPEMLEGFVLQESQGKP